jgi:hypothetical protein
MRRPKARAPSAQASSITFKGLQTGQDEQIWKRRQGFNTEQGRTGQIQALAVDAGFRW